MQRAEFAPIFRKMAIAYGSRLDDDAETILVYYELLQDLPTQLVQAAAVEYMTSPAAFPPTPGQIRAHAIDLQKRANNVPSPDEAWKMVDEAPIDGLEKWSEEIDGEWHIYNQPYQWPSALVEQVARNLGWPDRFWSNNLASDRARFIDTYKATVDRETMRATSLESVNKYLESRGNGDIKSLLSGFKRDAYERGE